MRTKTSTIATCAPVSGLSIDRLCLILKAFYATTTYPQIGFCKNNCFSLVRALFSRSISIISPSKELDEPTPSEPGLAGRVSTSSAVAPIEACQAYMGIAQKMDKEGSSDNGGKIRGGACARRGRAASSVVDFPTEVWSNVESKPALQGSTASTPAAAAATPRIALIKDNTKRILCMIQRQAEFESRAQGAFAWLQKRPRLPYRLSLSYLGAVFGVVAILSVALCGTLFPQTLYQFLT